ncbi:MAG: hypothetical protein ABI549_10210 [Flavobacterium sp.]|uniref:hypothetical protein n=1 Tax=Flavobacterium sp. TaxID=239 RepID=UPI0032663503
MKKIVLLIIVIFSVISCSTDVEGDKFHLELLPIDSAVLPVEFKKDSVYELPFNYIRPSTCHIFEGFYYEKNLNVRTIAIQTSVIEQSNCTTATVNPITEILQFKPTTETSYVFKLWKGTDANGADVYEEITIPVVP